MKHAIYTEKLGTIINYSHCYLLAKLRTMLPITDLCKKQKLYCKLMKLELSDVKSDEG
jgi:hypothetical protein